MVEINCARLNAVDTGRHFKHSMKIKRQLLHENSCTHDTCQNMDASMKI